MVVDEVRQQTLAWMVVIEASREHWSWMIVEKTRRRRTTGRRKEGRQLTQNLTTLTWQVGRNTQEDTTDHITCFLLNSSMMTYVLPLARDREDDGSNAPTNVPMSQIHHVTIAVIHNRQSICD